MMEKATQDLYKLTEAGPTASQANDLIRTFTLAVSTFRAVKETVRRSYI